MDHLFQLSDPYPHEVIEIPCYTCKDYEYTADSSAWYSYPQRDGWEDWDNKKRIERESKAWLAFMQRWMFFGTLSEVLGTQIRYFDFSRAAEQGQRIVWTGNLRQAFLDRRIQCFHLPMAERAKFRNDMWKLLDFMATALINNYEISRSTENQVMLEFSLSLRIMEASLRDFVGSLNFSKDGPGSVVSHQRRPASQHLHPLIESRFRRCGWCPRLLRTISVEVPLDTQWILSAMRRSRAHHHECRPDHCTVATIHSSDYKTQHASSCTSCSLVFDTVLMEGDLNTKINITSIVTKYIQQGKLPVLIFEGSQLKISSSTSTQGFERKYVAVSHVWADGLGNNQSNAIYSCQLARLQAYADEIYPSISGHTPFWIDTLCVPVSPKSARSMAIAKMAAVYKNAVTVIVLDEDLLATDPSIDEAEIAMQINNSCWMTRLWTYQEGCLASNLVFKLKSGFYHQDNLHSSFEKLYHRLNFTGATQQANELQGTFCYLGKAGLNKEDAEKGGELYVIAKAIQTRTTSRAEDEVICISTLMNRDVTSILGLGTSEERTMEFYRTLPYIPWTILFTTGQKINKHSFRWAPRSLLNMRTQFFNGPKQVGSRWTSKGLKGFGPAFLFSDFGTAKSKHLFYMREVTQLNEWFLITSRGEDLRDAKERALHSWGPERPFNVSNPFTSALFLSDYPTLGNPQRNGAIVEVQNDFPLDASLKTIHCIYERPVSVTRINLDDEKERKLHGQTIEYLCSDTYGPLLFRDGWGRNGIYCPDFTWYIA